MAPKSMNLNSTPRAKPATTTVSTTPKPSVKEKHTEPTTGYIVRPTVPTPGLRIYANDSVLKCHGVSNGELVRVWKALDSVSGGGSGGLSAVGQIFAEGATAIDGAVLQLSFGLRGLLDVLLGDRVRLEKYKGAVGEAGGVDVSSQPLESTETVEVKEDSVMQVLRAYH